ncbi:RAD51-associated protein 2 [Engystomops pustulosus]|uniref:RAD51-associated protein 2 n=1 Tax=Engystomops pustulosus TaxID=76066 RepID=UPI003AFB3337
MEKTNVDFICYTTDEDRFVKACHRIKASSKENTSTPVLKSAQETRCNVKAGSKVSDDGCYFGSVRKSLVISSSSLGVTEEVFSSTFIPQSDSSVDYTKLCASVGPKGRCKVPDDSDENLCLTNNTDSNINLHVRLSAHPRILTSDVILSNVNCGETGERQGQTPFNWAACESKMIQEGMAIVGNILKSSQKISPSLPCIHKKNRHCGSNDNSFLPRGKTSSMRLNFPQSLEKEHFLQDIDFSIFEASLHVTSNNDFPFSHMTGLESISHETTDESFSLKHKAEVEVSLGAENLNKSPGRAHLDYKTALNKHDFCFPSRVHSGVDAEQSEKEASGKKVDFYMESTRSKQVSYKERFQKICLEKCLVKSESSNSKERYCSFRSGMLFYNSKSRQDNMTIVEYKPSECESKCQYIKQQHSHQPCTQDTVDKESNEDVVSGNMYSNDTYRHDIEEAYVDERDREGVVEVDVTVTNFDSMEEENQHVASYISDGLENRSALSFLCVETVLNNNTEHQCDPKQETELVAPLEVTKRSYDRSAVLLYNEDFKMKAQFDLVLEELKVFHTIEEEVDTQNIKIVQQKSLGHTCDSTKKLQDGAALDTQNIKIVQQKSLGHTCDSTKKLQDGAAQDFTSYKVKVGSNLEENNDRSAVLLNNADFRMKDQMDLVLEELKMFHSTEQEEKENKIVKTIVQPKRLGHTCRNSIKLQDGASENFTSNKVNVVQNFEIIVTKDDWRMCDRKTTAEVKEQEVPQQYVSSYPTDDQSLYSVDNVEDTPKSLSWTPAFMKSSDREANITSHNEKAVTFSHGIVRVTPLKTRAGPLRIGLSKKAKIKQLHPYLR